MTLDIGAQAPVFTLISAENKKISLTDFKGKKVVLYFYPKDNTSGCTAQACDFRDEYAKFKKSDVQIIGISRDSVTSHQKFKTKYELPFVLLADIDTSVCNAYGVMVEKSMYGRKYLGIERSTFLIDETGKIAAIWRKVKVSGHVSELLKVIKT